MELKIKRVHPNAIMPAYATDGAACFDLRAILDVSMAWVYLGAPRTFKTGLAFEVPPGWVMKIYSRSGHGFNHGVRLGNCVGVIDSDYRGEVAVMLTCDGTDRFGVRPGDRIAQAMLERVEPVTFVEVVELGDTARGAGGFGSTGAR